MIYAFYFDQMDRLVVLCLEILGAALELDLIHGKSASTIAPTPNVDLNMTQVNTTATSNITTTALKNASKLNMKMVEI